MAQNIWDATLDVDNNVKQNAFDWSHTNNLTTQIGRLTPVFCDLVPAKTSFRVKPNFGLQFMPMVFPIQTRMRATISWFRYPLRALWKDYKDFVGNFRQGLEEPYLNINSDTRLKKMASTGSLGDYLGLPTTAVGKYGSVVHKSFFSTGTADTIAETNNVPYNIGTLLTYMANKNVNRLQESAVSPTKPSVLAFQSTIGDDIDFDSPVTVTFDYSVESFSSNLSFFYATDSNIFSVIPASYNSSTLTWTLNFPTVVKENKRSYKIYAVAPTYTNSSGTSVQSYASVRESNSFRFVSLVPALTATLNYSTTPQSVTELTLNTSPWFNSSSVNSDNQIKISAYAFRAYEGIYNAFYRDNRNNPYYIDGVVQYNTWIPTYEGGADDNIYELRYANWERDFLTTSVQSPQQGQAPLVGITTYTTTGYQTNSDGTQSEVPVQKVALVDESGKRYAIEFQSNEEGLTGVNYVELENGTTVRSARNLLDLATSGISIPDLRMVNCYQKFLELNMRKGYSYKEIIEGRFDVNVRYADLLLPQFFGGFSRDMNMNAISQTVDQDSSGSGSYREALGSQAGVGYFTGATNHNIECFCDEESIIMGILVVTPLPVYTQLLPKHFTYRGLLDHFNPEFNNIGFQPISYKEVCPIQAYNDNPSSLSGTFGYQRPWYEYCQRYDQAHGLFRTSLSNFLMHRVFEVKPELAQSFLVIDPDQVTDVFSVTETTDKIYGQIRLDITCKLPVARIAIPRLD
ncbi:MAG: major capsid protein [Microviridae sp.]|nr:MAG: major capsid protein [Microviridae sp.]